jgi:hypothetical protein
MLMGFIDGKMGEAHKHEKRQLSASSSTVAEAYKGMGRVIDPLLIGDGWLACGTRANKPNLENGQYLNLLSIKHF